MATGNMITRTMRRALAMLAGQHFGGVRDLYEQFGYPRELSVETMLATYLRQDIAGRIVDAYPHATWREAPTIKSKDAEPDGPFQKAWEALVEPLKVWNVLARLDRLMNLGHFGALFLGLDKGEPTTAEARKAGGYRLLYLTPHGETSAQITTWNNDPRSPRFAQPEIYRLTTGVGWTGYGGAQIVVTAHWSRVLHVAEGALSDGLIGLPRLERVFNRLMDLDKVLGGGAEVFWQNGAALRAWKAEADAEWDPAEVEEMKQQLEELAHGLRRDVRLRGVEPQILAGAVVDPTGQVDKLLDAIAGASGIPKRILIGSERGELASSQDETNWTARIVERRQQWATPIVLRPFVERLIYLGVLPEPETGDFEIIWPDTDTLGETERATVALSKAQAVQAYVSSPGADLVIPPQEFRRWLGEEEESEFELGELTELADEALARARAAGGSEEEAAAAAAEAAEQERVQFNRSRLVANAEARPLYVRRDVLNWKDLDRWARAQGFEATVGEAMHVTIAYSRAPVDWMRVSEAWAPGDHGKQTGELKVAPGGPRVVEPLGDGGAIVLFFACAELAWRHREILECGASWDWPDYQPHVTITYKAPADFDWRAVEPYRGPIVLGPEIFEELDPDGKDTVEEA